jgi:hypothetical protein
VALARAAIEQRAHVNPGKGLTEAAFDLVLEARDMDAANAYLAALGELMEEKSDAQGNAA